MRNTDHNTKKKNAISIINTAIGNGKKYDKYIKIDFAEISYNKIYYLPSLRPNKAIEFLTNDIS